MSHDRNFRGFKCSPSFEPMRFLSFTYTHYICGYILSRVHGESLAVSLRRGEQSRGFRVANSVSTARAAFISLNCVRFTFDLD